MEASIPEQSPNESIEIPPKINDLINRYNNELAEFFDTEPLTDIDVVTFDSKKEIIDFYNSTRKDNVTAPNYLVGFSPENHIYIVGPDGMPPSNKDEGAIRFQKVLKHELTHKYLRNICTRSTPAWLVEGICEYLAGQTPDEVTRDEITIDLLNSLSSTQNGDKYRIGKFMVDQIMSDFDKNKLFELVGIETSDKRNEELLKMFSWLNN